MVRGLLVMTSEELYEAQIRAMRMGSHETAIRCHREIVRRAAERLGRGVEALASTLAA